MVGKVKYPAKAALARFLPIKNHLNNMADYLLQAGEREMAEKAIDFKERELSDFELDVWSLAQMEMRNARNRTL